MFHEPDTGPIMSAENGTAVGTCDEAANGPNALGDARLERFGRELSEVEGQSARGEEEESLEGWS